MKTQDLMIKFYKTMTVTFYWNKRTEQNLFIQILTAFLHSNFSNKNLLQPVSSGGSRKL